MTGDSDLRGHPHGRRGRVGADRVPAHALTRTSATEHIVFTYEDDLWLVPAAGGQARRLTSGPGFETAGKFSPDGAVDRLHRRLRRRHRRLRDADRRRRAAAPDLPPGARPGARLAPRRPAHPLPLAARASARPAAALPGRPRRRPAREGRRRPRRPRRATRPTASASPTTASPARAPPGSATRAAWPRTSGWPTSPRAPSRRSPTSTGTDSFPMWWQDRHRLPERPRGRHPQPLRDDAHRRRTSRA